MRALFTLVALTLLLAACSANQTGPQTGSQTADGQSTEPLAGPTSEDPVGQGSETAETGDLSPVTAPPPAPSPPLLTPQDIIGKSPAYVVALLGRPAFVRRDGRVQTLLFRSETCIFDIGFIEKVAGAAFEANHISARDETGQVRDKDTCLRTLLEAPAE